MAPCSNIFVRTYVKPSRYRLALEQRRGREDVKTLRFPCSRPFCQTIYLNSVLSFPNARNLGVEKLFFFRYPKGDEQTTIVRVRQLI